MVVGRPGRNQNSTSRCTITNCIVVCNNAPYYGDFEEDIINAASVYSQFSLYHNIAKMHSILIKNNKILIHVFQEANAQPQCETISLKLSGPVFKNFEIPPGWLWSMTSHVRELAIIGGNIKHIAPDAFMSPFGGNIQVLLLSEIELNVWENDMLVGLSNLETLLLKDCLLFDIRKGALEPLDDSLKLLDIKASNNWNPVNFTGSTRLSELEVVDFSYNNFHDILNNASFLKLTACKKLFLNSCHIVSLGPGTFDYLESIQHLYLNDNSIVTVPVGLFDRILPREPSLALQDNLWHCDCFREDIRNIVRKEMLIVDPICHSPGAVIGMTFSDFEGYCKIKDDNDVANSGRDVLKTNTRVNTTSKVIYMNGACNDNITSNFHQEEPLQVIAFSEQQNCFLNRINREDIKKFSDNRLISDNDWIKPLFFVQNNPYSMVEIISSAPPGYGLLWYQSSCDSLVYCVNTIPHVLKVFNIDVGNHFTFCPFNLSSGTVLSSHCLSYNLAQTRSINSQYAFSHHEVIWFVCLSLGCLTCGAICVYGMIQRNPTLLKGSKRVLFVKHRSVEALILPPRFPMRKYGKESYVPKYNFSEKNKIFILPNKLDIITCHNFARSVSMKSEESNEASYISALQPTEEDLTEWRSNQIVRQFDNAAPDLSMIPYTSIYERESLPSYSYDTEERVYEVPKQF